MILYDELYFDIKITGQKNDIKKFVNFLKSGELDEFLEFSSDYILYEDEYNDRSDSEETNIVFSNDDCGIEIDEFDTDEFLEVLCKAAKALDVRGQLYDYDEDEYSFISEAGLSYYINSKNIDRFNEDEEYGNDSEKEDEDEEE